MEKNIISETVNQLGNELKLNLNPEFRMRVDQIQGDFIRLGVSNWDHHSGSDWVGTGRITQKCDELGIPYMLGELGNEYIIISKENLPKLDINSLQSNFSAACEYPKRYFKSEILNSGKYLFVSDVHGYDENLDKELRKIAKEKTPEIVFFLGDIIGTKLLDELQKKFYDVFNAMKSLGEGDNEQILIYIGSKIEKLWELLNDISPMEPINRVEWAKEIASFTHYGHFVSNLPTEIRQALRQGLLHNAELMYGVMKEFTRRGSLVVLIEGNWDARTPLDFQPTKDCLAIPVRKRNFYFQKFIKAKRNKHIFFVDHHTSIETEDAIFQTLSFDGIMNYQSGDFRSHHDITVSKKPTVLVSHAQAAWEAVKKNTPMNNEGKKVSEKMWSILSDLEPEQCVHGHLHDKLLDEVGNECDGYSYWKFNYMKTHYLPIRSFRFINF